MVIICILSTTWTVYGSPGHVSKRVNGSAIETLFCQLKHTTSGHLTGTNYEAAKATLLTQRQAKGKEAYRSASLYIAQSKLAKKWTTEKVNVGF